ncbi:hypothetical protein [Ramlibacter rhizophilus]|uniref:hypothetical protein n=1 Tax=Ramlibacter rhizophilus TaxID=1781167 RepID=UPI0014325390|nr:hypothetical protein [Ramlibacter rhizophilus]
MATYRHPNAHAYRLCFVNEPQAPGSTFAPPFAFLRCDQRSLEFYTSFEDPVKLFFFLPPRPEHLAVISSLSAEPSIMPRLFST